MSKVNIAWAETAGLLYNCDYNGKEARVWLTSTMQAEQVPRM